MKKLSPKIITMLCFSTSFTSYILLYLYFPLNSVQQELLGYEILSSELESVNINPSQFKGPTIVQRNNQQFLKWELRKDNEYIAAYLTPPRQRIKHWRNNIIEYESSSDEIWTKANKYYEKMKL